MKKIPNDIVLRPRFQLHLAETKENLLESLEKSEKYPFLIKRVDEHIFIKFNSKENHFWSPRLHLEIIAKDEHYSNLCGVFGPNPTLWTFFMFLHFGVATLFIILGVWAYSSAVLKNPYNMQLGLMVFLVILWFVLYFFGRVGKQKGKPQMKELYGFVMETILNDNEG